MMLAFQSVFSFSFEFPNVLLYLPAQGRQFKMSWVIIRQCWMELIFFAFFPHPVDGLHDQWKHGQWGQRIPDWSSHQQDLRLCRTLPFISFVESALTPWVLLVCYSFEELRNIQFFFLFFFLPLWQEAAWTVTDECIQVMGGMGFMKVSAAACLVHENIEAAEKLMTGCGRPSGRE